MAECEHQLLGAREVYIKAVELFPHKWPWIESKLKETPLKFLSLDDIKMHVPYIEAFDTVANYLSDQGWELDNYELPNGLHAFTRKCLA